jgi:biotin carboxyl carrier protein
MERRDRTNGRYLVTVGGQSYVIEPGTGRVELDGKVLPADVADLGDGQFHVLVEGRSVRLSVDDDAGAPVRAQIDGRFYEVTIADERERLLREAGRQTQREGERCEVRAPMPGLVLAVLVDAGAEVEEGTPLVVLEAMKMENEVASPQRGVIRTVHVEAGLVVAKNQVLVTIG